MKTYEYNGEIYTVKNKNDISDNIKNALQLFVNAVDNTDKSTNTNSISPVISLSSNTNSKMVFVNDPDNLTAEEVAKLYKEG